MRAADFHNIGTIRAFAQAIGCHYPRVYNNPYKPETLESRQYANGFFEGQDKCGGVIGGPTILEPGIGEAKPPTPAA